MADMKQRAAWYERKAAFTKYLPRVSATGAYLHTNKEISLLSDEQKSKLSNLGTTVGSLVPALESMTGALNGVGSGLVEALHTDTRNMGTVAVMLTQPVYMGGKIVAYNRITRYAEQIASHQHDLTLQEVIVEVDEVYWQIVSLQNKKRLAESFLKLVQKLDNDVQQMITEGVATKADGLSVKVKVNEAQVALIQVDNGLFTLADATLPTLWIGNGYTRNIGRREHGCHPNAQCGNHGRCTDCFRTPPRIECTLPFY